MEKYDWEEIIIREDRIIANSDRKQRAHFVSLDLISEEWLSHFNPGSYAYHFTDLEDENFVNNIHNTQLEYAMRTLTPKQLQAVKLIFWDGYKGYEAAKIMKCSPANVSILLKKALTRLRNDMDIC